MTDEIDYKFIKFRTFPWGPIDPEDMKINDFNIKLCYITDDEIKHIKFYECDIDNKVIINKLKCGYIARMENKYLNCKKYVNIDKDYFIKIYYEIYNMDFENIVNKSETGCDGDEFEVKIGKEKGLNYIYKKIGLWSPPCTNDNIVNDQVNRIDLFNNHLSYQPIIIDEATD